ncbi:MAG: serine/threonine protein phosphatase [Fidelibacterota bacterium]|nr:MAG: serine/threonine protein phosphatase [Candidatus Neomarinimicrobiota bacterium]
MGFDWRYIVIGDVHGNWRGVEYLLKEAGYKPGADRVIFVGDYNDHYANTDGSARKVIDLMIELHRTAPDATFFIRGNHDLWFGEWLQRGGAPHEMWYYQGGKATLESYGIEGDWTTQDQREKVPGPHQDFIFNLVDQYYLDDQVVAIHGGFTSERQMGVVARGELLDESDLKELVWDRYFIFSEDDTAQAHYAKYFGERYLVTGHTAEGPYVNPHNRKWILINSASRGENLSAVIISDEREYHFIRTD